MQPYRAFRAFSLICALLATSLAFAQQKTTTYCNGRFGFCIDYPPALLKPLPEAMNGDGRVFNDKSGHERLLTYGSGAWNYDDHGKVIPLSTLYTQELKGGKYKEPGAPLRLVTYKAMGRNSFVISGTAGGEIFYLKVVQHDDAFCRAYLHYPPELAAQYNPVAEIIGKTFR